ncbi:hypothetical protein SAMN05421823_11836 [Catalinimonas alkaloidigena]|uniref:Uncharacterized protein n=2 Tax=Catalinimonas alkaloidigena TaxID=1075417 RepID=A0A1G9UYB8_9BACT|nr:hypothetical protein SAMN05421823_11836 [Catalinimonas alkaloidigena]
MILTQKGRVVVKEGYRIFQQKEETYAQAVEGAYFHLRYEWVVVLINILRF